MAGKSYKQEQRTGTVEGFISDAFGDWQGLRDEMREWADSMEEKFSTTSKYETVSGTAETLEGRADDEPEVPDVVSGMEVTTTIFVKYGKERGSESRETRNSNACSMVDAALSAIEEKIDDLETSADELDSTELDDAKESYESVPDAETGLIYIQVASQQAVDKVITQEEADAVKTTVMAAFPDLDIESDNVDQIRDQITALEECRDTLQEIKDEFEPLEFPTMYG